MKTQLMYRDRDFKLDTKLPWQAELISQDLELTTLLEAMARGDSFLLEVSRAALLSGLGTDVDTILYRQDILRDCLNNQALVTELYSLTLGAIVEAKRAWWWGLSNRSVSSILSGATSLLELFLPPLKRLRSIAVEDSGRFASRGFEALFTLFRDELTEEYLDLIARHLVEVKFRRGALISASLGSSNESTDYILRQTDGKQRSWFQKVFTKRPAAYTFHIPERDENGARIVSEMRGRGTHRVAVALGESADNVLGFFAALRMELAFYIGCINLHQRLAALDAPVCFPAPASSCERTCHFSALHDVCLSLRRKESAVGNSLNADRKSLWIVTGANQGGKSTFLRSVGLAQMMMQCGMFVGAQEFTAATCPAVFTHYKREEDAELKSGKLDEELARMSEIVDHLTPDSILLCNESFAATNEREGSEIARQIVTALLEKRIKVIYVTHLYGFARGFFDRGVDEAMFLRAERNVDGARTFKVIEGEPLQTSFGRDLYSAVFRDAEIEA